MTHPLDKITVTGYKSIRNLENFELGSLNILIGANGSGKTNFISLFYMLHQMITENFQLYIGQSGGADRILHFGQQKTSELQIKLQFGVNGYDTSLVSSESNSLVFSKEICWFHNPKYRKPLELELGSGQKETNLLTDSRNNPETTRISDHVIRAIRSWRIYHFHDTSKTSKIKQSSDINDNNILRSNGENLAAYLFLLRETHPNSYKNIVSTIRLVAPFFEDFILRPNPLNPQNIQLEWKEKGSDAYFNAHALSDGTLRFMALSTLLMQPEFPSTIIIDEPELGLHPYAINILASLIQSASKVTQVIISTQSVTLVNHFSPEAIIIVDRNEGQSTFQRIDMEKLEEWIEEYTLGDMWEKNLVGGRPS